MDKELKDLQHQFNQIPTSFTSKDKQAVRDKIDTLQNNDRKKILHLYPKLLTGIVLAIVVLIFAVTLNQYPGQFMSISDDNAKSEANQDVNFEASITEQESLDNNTTNSTFDKVEESDAGDYSIPGEATNTYHETIELSDELLAIYEEYKETFDDSLLKGLSPFDIFKLHHYANYEDNLDVEYALYIKDERVDYPDKDTYLADVEYMREQSNYTPQQAKENYNEMLKINTFDELYPAENQALIRYTTDHDIGFSLVKDEELDVWKVSWMPVQ